jgi:hypothetical protein
MGPVGNIQKFRNSYDHHKHQFNCSRSEQLYKGVCGLNMGQ